MTTIIAGAPTPKELAENFAAMGRIVQRNAASLVHSRTRHRTLPVLVAKIDGYGDLARTTGRAYPVLFWLHSTQREHLHQRLTNAGTQHPIATAVRDAVTPATLSLADAVWRVHCQARAPLRLTDLSAPTASTSHPAA
jgi:hypothetical protein